MIMAFLISESKALKQATIEFSASVKTVNWSDSDGCLLDFAESLDIPALSSCRSGHCGACTVELLEGEVIYEQDICVELEEGEILLCSAKPATAHIKIKI